MLNFLKVTSLVNVLCLASTSLALTLPDNTADRAHTSDGYIQCDFGARLQDTDIDYLIGIIKLGPGGLKKDVVNKFETQGNITADTPKNKVFLMHIHYELFYPAKEDAWLQDVVGLWTIDSGGREYCDVPRG